MMKRMIDLNGDVGESFGLYSLGNDAELLNYVSSANIACGCHAGDPATMRRTVQLCKQRGVAIGAHPGFADLVGFGRRNMTLSPQEVFDLVVYQIGALQAFAATEGMKVRHVKPHGALYNMAAQDIALARAIAQAVQRVDPTMILVGLSGSQLITAGRELGLPTASEAFADRTYQADGSLTPRSQSDALIHDAHVAAARVVAMVQTGKITSQQGTEISLHADTVCLHGDSPNAVELARVIRSQLQSFGIDVQPFSSVD